MQKDDLGQILKFIRDNKIDHYVYIISEDAIFLERGGKKMAVIRGVYDEDMQPSFQHGIMGVSLKVTLRTILEMGIEKNKETF